jgi:glycosyltransferase involved in cell wall biosynthesis
VQTMAKISAFTVVKDALKQGYPFVESIASMLPVCDELLVSDGFSKDGTYEILQKIETLNKKVKVYQHGWIKKSPTVIADLSNELRKKCNFENLFYFQAPEIIHEHCIAALRAFPEMFPDADTFSLPFTTVIANLKAQEEYRLRLCKNIDRLNLTGDAWAFSVTKGFIRSEARKKLKNQKKLLNYVGRGIEWAYASALNNTRSRAVCLPTPILRYPCLFRENFIERCKGHADNINLPYYQNADKKYANAKGEAFFEKVVKEYRENNHINYVGDTGVFESLDHPAIIREFIEKRNSIMQYYVRDSVLDAIANS